MPHTVGRVRRHPRALYKSTASSTVGISVVSGLPTLKFPSISNRGTPFPVVFIKLGIVCQGGNSFKPGMAWLFQD